MRKSNLVAWSGERTTRKGDRSRYAALMKLSSSLMDVDDLAELGDAYFGQIGAVMDLPMQAIYLFNDDAQTPAWYESRNVSDRFMTTYEQCGRPVDEELRQALLTAAPVYNLAQRTIREWRETEVYQRVDRLENMVHVLKAPVVAGGTIIGTIDFASDSVGTEIGEIDMDLMVAIANVVGGAVINLRRREALQQQVAMSRMALETSSAAVVYFSAGSIDPQWTPSATELVCELQEGADILYRILRDVGVTSSVLHRSYLVRLTNGAKDVLECTVRPVPGEPGAQVLELALETARPRFRSPALQSLSTREYDVAGLVAAGFSDREIAEELTLSLHTVRQHVKNIYNKLGICSRVHLTRMYHGMTSRSVSARV
ncbi:MAG: LuxR C-terminal-related transcriptional regulator [Rhodococcus sp. (in: high G+C Gram-positive bacteria)]|uniref:LuxR C-terminal-related transcriptional regulator n=1 Tax=Rhodococcus sp. TaxID=1831 RepID=UPI003BAE4809